MYDSVTMNKMCFFYREPKLIFEKNLSQIVHRFDKIVQAQINANATRISLVVMKVSQ